MKFSLFLGCTVPNVYPGIEAATRKTMERFGVELLEVEGASCCPAPGAFGSVDKDLWLALGARNLTLAEANDADILTVCSGCFGSLYEVNHALKDDRDAMDRVNQVLGEVGREYKGERNVRHYVDVLSKDIGIDAIKKEVTHPLEGLKVGVHYGCHLLKPSADRDIDDPERPHILEDLIRALGADVIDYKDSHLCCGAGGGVRGSNLDESLVLAATKLDNVTEAGADLMVNPCSFCTLHYDMSQGAINEKYSKNHHVPVMHYAQFLALAMGFEPESVGLSHHAVSFDKILGVLG